MLPEYQARPSVVNKSNRERILNERFGSNQMTTTSPDRETRAIKGPALDLRIFSIRGNAAKNAAAISLPRRLPAVRTNTLWRCSRAGQQVPADDIPPSEARHNPLDHVRNDGRGFRRRSRI